MSGGGYDDDGVWVWNLDDPEDECEGAPDEDDGPDDDRWQEFKDGVATGLLNPDGSQREPDEPDFGAEEYARHCDEAHGGKACDCPPPDPDPWALPEGEAYAEGPPF